VDIANSDIVKVIYKCLNNANRSEVDKEMSTMATKVLINLAKYENTAASVWQVIQLVQYYGLTICLSMYILIHSFLQYVIHN